MNQLTKEQSDSHILNQLLEALDILRELPQTEHIQQSQISISLEIERITEDE